MSRANLLSPFDDFTRFSADVAFVHQRGYCRETWTYKQLAAEALRRAGQLKERGIWPTDRVLLWGPNSAEWAAVFGGCLCAGPLSSPSTIPPLPSLPPVSPLTPRSNSPSFRPPSHPSRLLSLPSSWRNPPTPHVFPPRFPPVNYATSASLATRLPKSSSPLGPPAIPVSSFSPTVTSSPISSHLRRASRSTGNSSVESRFRSISWPSWFRRYSAPTSSSKTRLSPTKSSKPSNANVPPLSLSSRACSIPFATHKSLSLVKPCRSHPVRRRVEIQPSISSRVRILLQSIQQRIRNSVSSIRHPQVHSLDLRAIRPVRQPPQRHAPHHLAIRSCQQDPCVIRKILPPKFPTVLANLHARRSVVFLHQPKGQINLRRVRPEDSDLHGSTACASRSVTKAPFWPSLTYVGPASCPEVTRRVRGGPPPITSLGCLRQMSKT